MEQSGVSEGLRASATKDDDSLSALGELIFLDRYARKDQERAHLEVGMRIVVCLNLKTKQRELAVVRGVDIESRLVRVLLDDGVEHEVAFDNVDVPVETFEQGKERLSRAIAAPEKDDVEQSRWEYRFRRLFGDGSSRPGFVPAGRIWAGAGIEEKLTPFNCFRAGTLVHTKHGVYPIEALVGQKVAVLSQDGVYRDADFASYGKQELFSVEFSNGDVEYATAGHEWLASKGGGSLRVVTTLDLEGMSVPLNPAVTGSEVTKGLEYTEGFRHGVVFGDGTKYTDRRTHVDLFGPKKDLLPLFENVGEPSTTTWSDGRVRVIALPGEWKELPGPRASGAYWRGFIMGLVATDGSVDENGSVCITQTDRLVLEAVTKNAPRAGLVADPVRVLREESNFGSGYAPCLVVRLRRPFVMEADLRREDQKARFVEAGAPERGRSVTVRRVRALNIEEEVYCCVEPETHTMTIGRGYLTKQCYVLAAPADSRGAIVANLNKMIEIMSRGGGVGMPLMSLRPRHGLVRGVNGRSSGSVSWGELYSFTTGLIEQGGSRRGALMLIQYCWHPDVFEFIEAKKQAGRLENCNISVALTDPFMDAVREDKSWDLVFPETTHPSFDAEWDGDLAAWVAKGYPVKTYKTIQARELWNRIVESAWTSAEPGVFFVDRYNAMSNSYYYQNGKIFCTNPCGEQGLPGNAVCNLGHLNLPKYLIGSGMGREPARLDWDALRQAVRDAVRFMDNVIDVAFMPLKENYDQQLAERRIGLGTMGLGEMLIRMHIRYGAGPECLAFLDELYREICVEAYLASSQLAEERGSFPKFDAEQFLNSGFAKNLPERVREAIRTKGLRNVTLLTQAPTGTVGTMMNTSTGIEPYPWWCWVRKGRLGKHTENANVYAEYLQAHADVAAARMEMTVELQAKTSSGLPTWFVTAAELRPEDHAHTQATIQRWVDSSISKTSNLPAEYTQEQVGEFYQLLYSLGCKGGTVYRDQSRSEQVLNLPTAAAPVVKKTPELKDIPEEVYDVQAVGVITPAGKLSTKIGYHPDTGEPFEVWLDVSKAGTAVTAFREALARMMSLILRVDSPILPTRRLQMIIEQLQGIGGGDTVGFGPNRVLSVPDGIAKGLEKLMTYRARFAKSEPVAPKEMVTALPTTPSKALDLCPNCHQASLYRSEGCEKCLSCAFSRC